MKLEFLFELIKISSIILRPVFFFSTPKNDKIQIFLIIHKLLSCLFYNNYLSNYRLHLSVGLQVPYRFIQTRFQVCLSRNTVSQQEHSSFIVKKEKKKKITYLTKFYLFHNECIYFISDSCYFFMYTAVGKKSKHYLLTLQLIIIEETY